MKIFSGFRENLKVKVEFDEYGKSAAKLLRLNEHGIWRRFNA
jgi:hypothetical protein